jgi:threonine/homoserine/homoserine lactone efflux protein
LGLDHQVLWAFTLLCSPSCPRPGANSLLIVHLALTSGWRNVDLALLGNLCGIASYALATLLGLAWLLAAAPSLRLAIYGSGGLYLLWVGTRLAQRGLKRTQAAEPSRAVAASAAGTFTRGLVTALRTYKPCSSSPVSLPASGFLAPILQPASPPSLSLSSATAPISRCSPS